MEKEMTIEEARQRVTELESQNLTKEGTLTHALEVLVQLLEEDRGDLLTTVSTLKTRSKQRESFNDMLERSDYLNQVANILDCAPRRVREILKARGYEGETLPMITEFLIDKCEIDPPDTQE